jgi:hypothetical protein
MCLNSTIEPQTSNIPPSPGKVLGKNAAKQRASNTCQAKHNPKKPHEKGYSLGFYDKRNNNIASACDSCTTSTCNGSSNNESSAILCDRCSQINIIPPHHLGALPQTRLPISNTNIEVRNDIFNGRYLYAFPQNDTNAPMKMRKAEPYQPTCAGQTLKPPEEENIPGRDCGTHR